MYEPQRDPFYEGFGANILDRAADADRGDLVDLGEVIRELRDESATAEI